MRDVWVVAGPAGCGKTSVGTNLAKSLALPFLEGDAYHPQANIDKMSANIPLTDEDRYPWLQSLAEHAALALDQGAAGIVLTCSTLKRQYRDIFREAHGSSGDISSHFIYLVAPEEILLARVRARQGHYMKDSMVQSQFVDLQIPSTDEPDCFVIDVSGPEHKVQEDVLAIVRSILQNSTVDIKP